MLAIIIIIIIINYQPTYMHDAWLYWEKGEKHTLFSTQMKSVSFNTLASLNFVPPVSMNF